MCSTEPNNINNGERQQRDSDDVGDAFGSLGISRRRICIILYSEEAPRQGAAAHEEVPRQGTAAQEEAPRQGAAAQEEAPRGWGPQRMGGAGESGVSPLAYSPPWWNREVDGCPTSR